MSNRGKKPSPHRQEQRVDGGESCEEEEEEVIQGVWSVSEPEDEEQHHDSSNHTNSSMTQTDKSFVGRLRSNVSNFVSLFTMRGTPDAGKVGSPRRQPVRRPVGSQGDMSGRQQQQTREQMAAEPRKRPHCETVDEVDTDRHQEEADEKEGVEQQNEENREGSIVIHDSNYHEMVKKRRRLNYNEPPVAPGNAAKPKAALQRGFSCSTGALYQGAGTDRTSLRGSSYGRPMSVAGAMRKNRTQRCSSSLFHYANRASATVTSARENEPVGESIVRYAAPPTDRDSLMKRFRLDETQNDPARRLTTFTGNAHYRQWMEQQRLNSVTGLFRLGSTARSLGSSIESLSSASSFRPSYNSNASGRLPPELGGSVFYDGPTRYGGASAANTLAINVDVTRPTGRTTSLLRVPDTRTTVGGGGATAAVAASQQELSGAFGFSPTLNSSFKSVMIQFNDMKKNSQRRHESGRSRQAYPYGDLSSPRIPEHFGLLREHSRTEAVESAPKGPPTKPLMVYTVLGLGRQDSPADGQQMTGQGSQPVSETNQGRENVRQPERESRSEPAAAARPSPEPSPPPVNGNLAVSDGEEEEQEEDEVEDEEEPDEVEEEEEELQVVTAEEKSTDQVEQHTEEQKSDRNDTLTLEPTPHTQFTFASPSVLPVSSPLDDGPVAITSFVFSETEPLSSRESSPASIWKCKDCNDWNTHDAHCRACGSSKRTTGKPDRREQSAAPQSSVPMDSTFQALVAKTANNWVCDSCMISNAPELTKCVACKNTKPATSKPGRREQSAAPQSSVPMDSTFQALVAKTANNWVCDSCMISNAPELTKCVACKNSKPATSKPGGREQSAAPQSSVPMDSTFQALVAKTANNWVCDSCMISNAPELTKCVACKHSKPATSKPGGREQSAAPPQPPAASSTVVSGAVSSGFAAIVAAQSAQWECTDCGVRNDQSKAVCACCQMARPGSEPTVKAGDTREETLPAPVATSSPTLAAGFRFGAFNGVEKPVSTVPFTFGTLPAKNVTDNNNASNAKLSFTGSTPPLSNPKDVFLPFNTSCSPNTCDITQQLQPQLSFNDDGNDSAASSNLFSVPEEFNFANAGAWFDWDIDTDSKAEDDTGGETVAAPVNQQAQQQPLQHQAEEPVFWELDPHFDADLQYAEELLSDENLLPYKMETDDDFHGYEESEDLHDCRRLSVERVRRRLFPDAEEHVMPVVASDDSRPRHVKRPHHVRRLFSSDEKK